MSTSAHGAGWPYSRSLGRHFSLMIFHSASGSARLAVADASSARTARNARSARRGTLVDDDARRGAAGARARHLGPDLGGDLAEQLGVRRARLGHGDRAPVIRGF